MMRQTMIAVAALAMCSLTMAADCDKANRGCDVPYAKQIDKTKVVNEKEIPDCKQYSTTCAFYFTPNFNPSSGVPDEYFAGNLNARNGAASQAQYVKPTNAFPTDSRFVVTQQPAYGSVKWKNTLGGIFVYHPEPNDKGKNGPVIAKTGNVKDEFNDEFAYAIKTAKGTSNWGKVVLIIKVVNGSDMALNLTIILTSFVVGATCLGLVRVVALQLLLHDEKTYCLPQESPAEGLDLPLADDAGDSEGKEGEEAAVADTRTEVQAPDTMSGEDGTGRGEQQFHFTGFRDTENPIDGTILFKANGELSGQVMEKKSKGRGKVLCDIEGIWFQDPKALGAATRMAYGYTYEGANIEVEATTALEFSISNKVNGTWGNKRDSPYPFHSGFPLTDGSVSYVLEKMQPSFDF